MWRSGVSREESSGADDAGTLARAFDQSFAASQQTTTEDTEDLLGANVEGGAYLLRLREVKGLVSRPAIVPVPTPVAEFLGVMGLRGNVVPVYGLGGLLGHPLRAERVVWVCLVDTGSTSVGLGVEEFTGHLRLLRREIATAPGANVGVHVRETARVGEVLRGIIDVRAVVASIQERVRTFSGNKET
jgi:chemotaxis signal transduction protein